MGDFGSQSVTDLVGMDWGAVNIWGWLGLAVAAIAFTIYAIRFFKQKKKEEERE